MWGLRSSRTVAIVAAAGLFVAFSVMPAAYMLGSALPVVGFVPLLDSRQGGLLYNTALLGLGTSILATFVGVPLGFALARVPLPFKTAVRLALLAPAVLPPYVVAMAWVSLHALSSRVSGNLFDPYSVVGAAVVLAIVFYPLPMLATEVALSRVEARLEEAALLAAPLRRVLRRITGPLIAPAVVAAALVVFVLAISEFSVPGLLRVRVFTTEVFTAFAALYDFGRATALALPLLLVSALVAASAGRVVGGRLVSTRRAGSASAAFANWRRGAVAMIAIVILTTLLVPLAALSLEAARATSIASVLRGSGEAVMTSLLSGAAGATAVTALAAILGYARARTTPRAGAALDVLWLILFAVPSTVVGVGLIGVWNRPGLLGALYGTNAMLVFGYLARFTPVAALILGATIRSVAASQEEAAAIAGASWRRTMFRIVLPQVSSGLAAVWVIAFVLAFGEVGTSILVAPPGESTLPIRVYTLTANAPPGHTATLALFQSAVVLAPLVLFGIVTGRRTAR
jgi:iron(III) transport system permease protein